MNFICDDLRTSGRISLNDEVFVDITRIEISPDASTHIEGFLSHYSKGLKDPIERVIFNNPAVIVFWKDGAKTIVKCGPDDVFDAEKGLAMAIAKKYLGNKGNYNNIFKKYLNEV